MKTTARKEIMARTTTGGGSAQQQPENDPSRRIFLILTFIPVCLVLVYDATGERWRNKNHDDALNILSPSACYYAAALLGAFGGYGATTHPNAENWEVPLGIGCGILGYTCATWAGSSYLLSVGNGAASTEVVTMVTAFGAFPGVALYAFLHMLIKEPFQRRRRRRELPVEEAESLVELEQSASNE